ncbi:MAG: hypothetical protein ABL871_05160 [Terricaulis sp.]
MNLGRDARSHWTLDPDGVFLNHGSFGACPITVLEMQNAIRARIERHPDHFFIREIEPREGAVPQTSLRAAANALAEFVGAPKRPTCLR